MPDTLHPPYNVVQPRQLDRWLDVNAQNGQLQRFQYYFTVPGFSINQVFNQCSDIVGDFWYKSPNSFSLLLPLSAVIPSNVNYLMAIGFTKSGITYRYALNNCPTYVGYPITPYTNQIIRPNFRIEIWSTPSSPTIQTTGQNFFSTVRGNTDYRYGVDTSIANPAALETNYNSPNLNLPLVFPQTIYSN